MGYSEQFAVYRETRGLSREDLARKAGCHRNTVLHVENGRPVKFATIARLMEAMGYGPASEELKLIAVQWLEDATGIKFSLAQVRRIKDREDAEVQQIFDRLHAVAAHRALTKEQLSLLLFAAEHEAVLNALRSIRELVRRHSPA